MNWKTTLTSAALAAVTLIPSAALADHEPHVAVSVSVPPVELHVHGPGCHHEALPPRPPQGNPQYQPSGRYELRTVSNWVPGRYEQVWQQGACYTKHKHKRHGRHIEKTVCEQGRYVDQWVPGRYEQVEQWVWVENPRPVMYGRFVPAGR